MVEELEESWLELSTAFFMAFNKFVGGNSFSLSRLGAWVNPPGRLPKLTMEEDRKVLRHHGL